MTQDIIARVEHLKMAFNIAIAFIHPNDFRNYAALMEVLEAQKDATLIEDLRKELEWRPLESAPLDGNTILLGRHDGVSIGYWDRNVEKVGDCGGPCRCPEYDSLGEPFWATDNGETAFSHWRPLPTPPAAKEPGDGNA